MHQYKNSTIIYCYKGVNKITNSLLYDNLNPVNNYKLENNVNCNIFVVFLNNKIVVFCCYKLKYKIVPL